MTGSDLRKARSYELQAHEDEIRRRIASDGWKLKQIQSYFVEEYGLYATENMWKKLFKKLGLRLKKNRFEVMEAAAQHYQACLDAEVPFLYVIPQHKPITAEELWRYARRGGWTIVNGRLERPIGTSSSPSTIKMEWPMDDSNNDLDNSDSMDTIEDDGCINPVELELCDVVEEIKRPDLDEDSMKMEEVEYPSGSIIKAPTTGMARAYLNQAGYARSPVITSPDVYISRENLLRALDLATASSFDSGRASIDQHGWGKITEYTFQAIDRAGEIYCHFEDAGRCSQRGRMRKAWRHYRAGLSCLFFGLEHCFPLAIANLFWACGKLYAAKLEHMVKILSWHTSQWCQQSCQPPEVAEIFTNLYKTDESHTVQTLIGAQEVTGMQLKRRTSDLHTEVYRSRIDIIRLEMLINPKHGIERLLHELELVQSMGYAPADAELYLMSEISDACGISGEYEIGLEIALEGLRKCSDEDGNIDTESALVFAKDVVGHSRIIGQGQKALLRIDPLLTSILSRETMYRSDLIVTLLEEVILLHKELGNFSEVAYYKAVVHRVQNYGMEELEEALLRLGFNSTEPPPQGGETAQPQIQQCWVTEEAESPRTNPAWRQDVPSDARDNLVLPGIDS